MDIVFILYMDDMQMRKLIVFFYKFEFIKNQKQIQHFKKCPLFSMILFYIYITQYSYGRNLMNFE